MAKYRKKPVVIEAVQVTKDYLKSKPTVERFETLDGTSFAITYTEDAALIQTMEGTMAAELGDWILTGIQNEMYPCKDDIFKASFDLVETKTWEFDETPTPEDYREAIESLRNQFHELYEEDAGVWGNYMLEVSTDEKNNCLNMSLVPRY